MRRALLLALTLLLLTPTLAGASPRPIALADYRWKLAQGVHYLQQAHRTASSEPSSSRAALGGAQELLQGEWRVETPHGTVTANLESLAKLLRQAAVEGGRPNQAWWQAYELAQEHLRYADALYQATPVDAPGARADLERALEQTAARSAIQRFQDWLSALIGRRLGQGAEAVAKTPPWVTWVLGFFALAGLIWIGLSLYRSLTGHAGAKVTAMGRGAAARPERPPTPAELRHEAQALSAQGHHLEALRTAHLALLLRYDERKLIRYQPAQTNREHERQLYRAHPHLARSLRTLNELVDVRLYWGQGATLEDYMRVEGLVDQLWREGDAASNGAEATPGASSLASSR